MAFDRQFDLGLIWRLALILALGALTLLAFLEGGGAATRILLVAASIGAIADLWFHLRRTNLAVARFVEAIRFDDFSQRFTLGRGTGFEALGKALDSAIVELGAKRAEAAEDARFLSAVVDDAPAALLTIDEDDRVTLLNKAARRQFVDQPGVRVADFAAYGAEFVAALGLAAVGSAADPIDQGWRRPARDDRNRADRAAGQQFADRLGPSGAECPRRGGDGGAKRPGPGPDARDHEFADARSHRWCARPPTSWPPPSRIPKALAEARQAVEIAASRAEGMHRFVETYRSFARLPEIRRRRFAAEPWAAEIARLCAADPVTAKIALDVAVPAEFSLDADPDLMAQVCLNLLRNAATAARNHAAEPRVGMTLQPSGDGGARIEIYDNGPGIDPDRREDIFLPFYTTRPDGTGVGLSFARQIVVAHGGTISAGVSPIGGASIIAII